MIELTQAQTLIFEHALKLSHEKISIFSALGRSLAKDIFAPIDLPPFDNSAVDGFAFEKSAVMARTLGAEIRANVQERAFLKPDEAFRIMTGAPIPEGADAVIMKEDAEVIGRQVHFKRALLKNENIRFKGEDIQSQEMVLKAGTIIKPQNIGLLLALGICDIEVFKPPKMRIIATGDELVEAPTPLKFGQVYHLMGPMLKAQAKLLGITDVEYQLVGDDQEAIKRALRSSMDADIVLLSGGISLGEHDLVKPALESLGVKEIFHRGAWRPGKPLFFGRKGSTRIFALPGNPVSAFTCFHLFVRALIHRSLGHEYLPKNAILLNDFSKKSKEAFFAQSVVKDGLRILWPQGSHRIFGLNQANALCLLPEASVIVKAGESVKYYPI